MPMIAAYKCSIRMQKERGTCQHPNITLSLGLRQLDEGDWKDAENASTAKKAQLNRGHCYPRNSNASA